jgi:IMP dehydrogenase
MKKKKFQSFLQATFFFWNFQEDVFDVVPEGVEATVPYRGAVESIVKQLIGGLASGISYCGAHDIQGMQMNAEFVKITGAGKSESGSHDVSVI